MSVSAEGQYDYWTGSPDYDYTHNTVIGNSSRILFYVNDDQYGWGGSVPAPQGAIPPKIIILLQTARSLPPTMFLYLSKPPHQKMHQSSLTSG